MEDRDCKMPEAKFLEEVAVLLRKEHEGLQVHLDMRLAQQEKLLQQLVQGLAHRSGLEADPNHEILSACTAAQNDSEHGASSHGIQLQCTGHNSVQHLQSNIESATCSVEKACNQEILLPCAAQYESQDMTSSQKGQVLGGPHNVIQDLGFGSDEKQFAKVDSKGPSTCKAKKEVPLLPSGTNNSFFGILRTSPETHQSHSSGKKGRASSTHSTSSDSSGLHKRRSFLLHELKLGKTSPSRVVKDLEDQFRRLAGSGAARLPIQRLMKVVNSFGEGMDLEDVLQAVRAMVPIDSDCPRPSHAPAAVMSSVSASMFTSLFRSAQVESALTFESFMNLMLDDSPPFEVEADVLCIREAVDNERSAHHDQLNEICVSRIKQKGGYGNSPLIVDVVGASVIVLNGLVIGLSSDIEPEHPIWRICEYVFLLHFVAEVTFHVWREGYSKFFCGREWRWNVFDFSLVVFAVSEAIISNIAESEGGSLAFLTRLLRMARLLRLVRLLRFKVFAEVKQMIYGVVAGVRVLAWAMMILIVFIYMVSLVLRQTIGSDKENMYSSYFDTVPWTMFTVFRCFTDGCVSDDGSPLQIYLYIRHGFLFMFLYVVVFLFVTMGIFNLIMATFIDNAMRVSTESKQIERAGNEHKLKAELAALIVRFWSCDQDTLKRMKTFGRLNEVSERQERDVMRALSEVLVTREMLQLWFCHPDMIDILARLEISHSEHSRLFDALDCDLSGELEGHELVQGLMALRGPIEKVDVVSTMLAMRFVVAMVKNLEGCLPSSDPDRSTFQIAPSVR